MNKVLLIGAGNIGSRHLQGLRLVQTPLEIRVIDPSVEAQERAEKLFHKVEAEHQFNGNLTFAESLPQDESFDIAIVATSAGVRRSITEQLLEGNEINYLVLEKFLFQSLKDYDAIASLLEEKKVPAFVNCPRRLFPFYRELKEILESEEGPLEFHFSGTDWGLACNSVHRIDLFAFLTGHSDFDINVSGLQDRIVSSKREGYVEFYGRVEASTPRGDKMVVSSFSEGNAPNLQVINTPNRRYIISEKQRFMHLSTAANNWDWSLNEFAMPFQSQLTNIFVEQLLKTESCDLTSYEESSKHHKAALSGMLSHMSKLKNEIIEVCPIT